jgi:hypothetical protein
MTPNIMGCISSQTLRSAHLRASRRMKPPTWKMLAMSDLLALR